MVAAPRKGDQEMPTRGARPEDSVSSRSQAAEAVDVEGDAVVEPAEAGVYDGGGAAKGGPGNADAGSQAEGFGEFLRFGAHAEIHSQAGSENPVIMGE